jgi:microcystin-dependent protein
MAGRQSKKHTYKYHSLYLNDGTHTKAEENYHEVKPSYAGDLKYSVQSTDHNGWLKCDGRSISRVLYAKLFEVIGTSFGSDDADTFKLPDCRGRVLGTIGTGTGLTARSLGDKVGAETHTLTVGEMPSHSHTINDPSHSHSYTNNTNNQQVSALPGETAADQEDLGATTGASTTGITINNTGGGGAHNNMQPTIFISNIFIFSR